MLSTKGLTARFSSNEMSSVLFDFTGSERVVAEQGWYQTPHLKITILATAYVRSSSASNLSGGSKFSLAPTSAATSAPSATDPGPVRGTLSLCRLVRRVLATDNIKPL